MVPRPRAPKGLDRPALVRDRGRAVRPHIASADTDPVVGRSAPAPRVGPAAAPPLPPSARIPDGPATVAVTRTAHGWTVTGSCGTEIVGGLIEGLTLADLVVEELGGIPEPDRNARRSARGAAPGTEVADPRDARIAALERTVAQLEHALAARVATERAIGMLVERHGVTPREAFDALRQEARGSSRPVQELARDVLDGTIDLAERLLPSQMGDVADGRS